MDQDAQAFGVLFAMLGMFAVVGLAISALAIIGLWKVFKKAGEEGWKSIIPVYNLYTLATIVGVSPLWILIIFIAIIIGSIFAPLSILSSALNLYFTVILLVSLARSFGKDDSFAVGLFFLGPIFYLILGCGSAEYQGKKPMKDPIMEFIDKEILKKDTTTPEANVTEEKTTPAAPAERFCTNCGAKVDSDSSFCTSCGTKVD